MSRSVRRSPFFSYTASRYVCGSESDKWWKKYWHRKMRAATLVVLRDFDVDSGFLPHTRQVSHIWASSKEGKIRFDPRQHPERMRK